MYALTETSPLSSFDLSSTALCMYGDLRASVNSVCLCGLIFRFPRSNSCITCPCLIENSYSSAFFWEIGVTTSGGCSKTSTS
ncbi:hypothetical protein Hanom_Chr04g00321661 [Helianthus anomalus]